MFGGEEGKLEPVVYLLPHSAAHHSACSRGEGDGRAGIKAAGSVTFSSPPNQKRSVGVIWSPAHSLRSLSHTQKGQQHLPLCPWSPLRAMPPALQVNIPAGQQPSEHCRFQQNPIPTGASMLGHEHGCLSETSPVLCTELFTSS